MPDAEPADNERFGLITAVLRSEGSYCENRLDTVSTPLVPVVGDPKIGTTLAFSNPQSQGGKMKMPYWEIV